MITPIPRTRTLRIRYLQSIRRLLRPFRNGRNSPRPADELVWAARQLSRLIMITTGNRYRLDLVDAQYGENRWNLETQGGAAEFQVSGWCEVE